MKLVGGVLLPQHGMMFIPPWLRVLHCSAEPLFFEDTMKANLTFGVHADDPLDGAVDRIVRICKLLELPDETIEKIHSESVEPWHDTLSRTQKSLLSIARALVANPAVLVVHTPALGFD